MSLNHMAISVSLALLLSSCAARALATPIADTPPHRLLPSPTHAEPTDTAAPQPPQTQRPLCLYEPDSVPTGLIRLAYVVPGGHDNAGIWYYDEDGVPSKIAAFEDASYLSISDDGKLVAFLRGDHSQPELWVSPVEHPDPRRLLSSSDIKAMASSKGILGPPGLSRPLWAPHSHSLLFTLFVPSDEDSPPLSAPQIWRLDADSQESTFLAVGSFDVSPNGQYVAVRHQSTLDIVSIDGDLLRADVIPDHRITDREGQPRTGPVSWSQDSLSLLIAVPEDPEAPSQATGSFSLLQVWTTDRPTTILGRFTGYARSTRLSPNHRFLFYQLNYWLRPSTLYLVDLPSRDNQLYASGDAIEFVSWLPDSYNFMLVETYDFLLGDVCLPFDDTALVPRHHTFDKMLLFPTTSTLLVVEFAEHRFIWLEDSATFHRKSAFMLADSYDFTLMQQH